MRRYLVALLLFIIVLSFFTGMGLAQTIQTLPDGIQIGVPESQQALPGQFITYTFLLRNPTPSEAVLRLRAWTENGWSLLGPEEDAVLPPFGEAFIPITMMVPDSAYGGTEERLTFSLTRDGKTRNFSVSTSITTIHKVSLNGPPRGQASPENDANYTITVVNHGSSPENIQFRVTSELGWTVRVQPELLHMEPGEQASVLLTHSVPKQALEGTTDAATLTIHYGSGNREDITIRTMALAGEKQTVTDLKIPIRSTFLWDLEMPESGQSAALRWAYRMNTVQNDYSLDFVADGLYNTDSHASPDTLYFTLTSPDHYLRFGRFDPYWAGVLPTPTQNSAFLWNWDQKRTNLQVILGTERDEEGFSDEFRWMAISADLPDSPWTFRFLLPASDEENLHQMAEIDYSKSFGSKDSSWQLRSRWGLGWGDDDTKRIGDLILQGYGDRWNLRCEYGLSDAFYTEYDRQRFYLTSYYRWNPSLALESGYAWWESNAWTDPNYNTTTHQGLWTRLKFQNYYSIYLGVDQEDTGSDHFLEPKLELRYARQREKDFYQINFIRRYRDYEIDDDIRYWTLESHYRHVYSPQHYFDLQADYNLATSSLSTDTDILRFRLGYSTPLSSSFSMTAILGATYDSAEDDSTDLTFRWELGYRPHTDGQWKLAVAYNDEYTTTDRWSVFAYYQGVFTNFFTPPWGSIQGIVFEDVNQNGHFDAQDLPIHARLILDAKDSLFTDASGRCSFAIVRSGSHVLTLDLADAPYYAVNNKWPVTVTRGKQEILEIPVRRKPFLRIHLFNDLGQDGVFTLDEPALAGVRLTLIQDGVAIVDATSTADGYIFFNNLLPGVYQLQIDNATLPPDISPFAGLTEIVVAHEAQTDLEWGFFTIEKPIEFTFDQTDADF